MKLCTAFLNFKGEISRVGNSNNITKNISVADAMCVTLSTLNFSIPDFPRSTVRKSGYFKIIVLVSYPIIYNPDIAYSFACWSFHLDHTKMRENFIYQAC